MILIDANLYLCKYACVHGVQLVDVNIYDVNIYDVNIYDVNFYDVNIFFFTTDEVRGISNETSC